ncbi:MAG: 2TM domain-containing protein [Rhodospirillales bacterium]|nr:2TM domain-containing protein [Rhodospirillales bacterium]
MDVERTERPQQTSTEDARGTARGAATRWMVRAFPWHLRAFLAANVVLTIANVFTRGYWWAFWPLVATGLVLGVHYLLYKATAVDDLWVEERIQELNLKSYDRSHIEDLKARHVAKKSKYRRLSRLTRHRPRCAPTRGRSAPKPTPSEGQGGGSQ